MIDDCVDCWAGLFCRNGNTLHPTSANESTKVMDILKAFAKRFCNCCISRPDSARQMMLWSKIPARPMASHVQWRRSSNDPAGQNLTTLTICLTRNPTCPNRWGSHERCRFIGGCRRVMYNHSSHTQLNGVFPSVSRCTVSLDLPNEVEEAFSSTLLNNFGALRMSSKKA